MTAGRATRQSPHDPLPAGISAHSCNAKLAGRLRPVSHPEAILVPFAPFRPPQSPLDPSFGASPGHSGSFRNLHCGQEAGGRNPNNSAYTEVARIVSRPSGNEFGSVSI